LARSAKSSRELRDFSTQHFWQWVVAQLYACPEAVPDARNPEAHGYVALALLPMILHALRADDRTGAEATLERIHGVRSPDLFWADHTSGELLLVSVLRAMLGDPAHLRDDLSEILARHRFKNRQVLWHDAAYLAGKLGAAAYRKQPGRAELAPRLAFVRAVKQDLDGRRPAAKRSYRQFVEGTQPYGSDNLLRHRFAAWRMEAM
jgi:hypothetical protein